MEKLFLSTTDSFDNGHIVSYYGVVSSYIVAGTGFLSDFAASFSDFFGGRSGSYRRQMQSLYNDALDELSKKASARGANAIVGLTINVNNIPGKGLSMFMITALGTAAKLVLDEESHDEPVIDSISNDALRSELKKISILENLEDDECGLQDEDWEYILKDPSEVYAIPLTRRYFTLAPLSQTKYRESFIDNYNSYIQLIDRKVAINALYDGLINNDYKGYAYDCIKYNDLFDAETVLDLLQQGKITVAISLLIIDQPSYNKTDLHNMEAILDVIDNLPDIGKNEVVKGGMFSKDEEKYICQHGHINPKDQEFCITCNENIKGLKKHDYDIIDQFKQKALMLKDLLDSQTNS